MTVKKYGLVCTGNGQLSTRTRVILLWAMPVGLQPTGLCPVLVKLICSSFRGEEQTRNKFFYVDDGNCGGSDVIGIHDASVDYQLTKANGRKTGRWGYHQSSFQLWLRCVDWISCGMTFRCWEVEAHSNVMVSGHGMPERYYCTYSCTVLTLINGN